MISRICSLIFLLLWLASPSWAASLLQTGITTHDGATNFTRTTTSNVTAGSLIVVSAARWKSGDNGAYIAGDLTKSAGTATIGTPVLEYTAAPGAPATSNRVGMWSVLVTGSGSLTLQVAHSGASYGSIVVAEYSGTWDGTRTEASASGSGSGTAARSGNASSAGAAVFVGSMTNSNVANTTITEDGAFTLLGEDQAGSDRTDHSCIGRIVSTATTDAAEWTISDSVWVGGVVVFKEASGGGGGGSVIRSMLLGVGP